MVPTPPAKVTGTGPGAATTWLHPGDVAFGWRDQQFRTLLGSCVAVAMTDPRRTAGVICHIVHTSPAPRPEATAHADAAIGAMCERLRANGLQPHLCDAYVYGGGNMFPGVYSDRPVGGRNVDAVLDALEHLGVRLLHHDVGGTAYRRVAWTVGDCAPAVIAVES